MRGAPWKDSAPGLRPKLRRGVEQAENGNDLDCAGPENLDQERGAPPTEPEARARAGSREPERLEQREAAEPALARSGARPWTPREEAERVGDLVP